MGIDNNSGIVTETDIGTVFAAKFFFGADNNHFDFFFLLDHAVGDGVFDNSQNNITNSGFFVKMTFVDMNNLDSFGAAVVSRFDDTSELNPNN